MSTHADVWADINGLYGLAGRIGTVVDDVGEVVTKVESVPAPTATSYGWQATADAMENVLDAWSAEISLVRSACRQISYSATAAAESLALAEGVNTGHIGSVPV